LILVDDLHPYVALAGVRQCDRHRAGIEVDYCERIQSVAIGSGNALLSGRGKLAPMPEFSETAVLDHAGEIDVGLGAIVVLDGNELGLGGGSLCRRYGTRHHYCIAAKILVCAFFIVSRAKHLPTIVDGSDMEENTHH
jgi:hypothetical protein